MTKHNMGASTESHIVGNDETGEFTTDQAPLGRTPASGSSNRGINTTPANQRDLVEDAETETEAEAEDSGD
jgi:hypothetical protein